MSLRDDFVNNSLKYVGVGFQHQGRNWEKFKIETEEDKKKIKVDCAGLVIETMDDTGLLKEGNDLKNYSRIPDGASLINHLNITCDLKSFDTLQKGDILVMAFGADATHLAIYLGDYMNIGADYIIHSYILSRKVVIHRFDSQWKDRVVGIYSIKNIDKENLSIEE